jgi:hypothetical protein
MLFTASFALPAFAAWDEVGRLSVSPNAERFEKDFRMGGPVERLRLTAEGDDILCRAVQAQFGNGADRQVFRGPLRRGQTTDIDLPGESRVIRNLSFQCRSEHRDGATIRIGADVGRYRDVWRRNPDFARFWARTFNWGSDLLNNWQLVGSENFRGRDEEESHFDGWRGKRVDSLALKPIGADARCRQVIAHFGNGRDRTLDVNRGDLLREDQFYKLDLPGDRRNVDSLSLRCSPANARQVTIQIFASK